MHWVTSSGNYAYDCVGEAKVYQILFNHFVCLFLLCKMCFIFQDSILNGVCEAQADCRVMGRNTNSPARNKKQMLFPDNCTGTTT